MKYYTNERRYRYEQGDNGAQRRQQPRNGRLEKKKEKEKEHETTKASQWNLANLARSSHYANVSISSRLPLERCRVTPLS